MSLPDELDTWVADLGTAVSLPGTRDPDLIHPPCLFASLPDGVGVTIGDQVDLEIPLWLVGAGVGKQAGDQLLTHLPAVLDAVGMKDAQFATLTVGGVDFHAYLMTVQLHVVPDPTP